MSRTLSPAILEEAADWAITLHFGSPSEQERAAFAIWHDKSSAHQEAWSRVESMRGSFHHLSSNVGKSALTELDQRHDQRKRTSMRRLGAVLLALPAGWLAWRQLPWPRWSADVATARGERQTLTLADGSQVVLNGDSAIDIVFTASERRLILRAGEILVTTHPDQAAPARPFLVQTAQGTARALGTVFSVRLDQDRSRVAVFEHAVEFVTRTGEKYLIPSGRQAIFDDSRMREMTLADPNARQWTNGMLIARDMRLADVIAALNQQYRGFLRCAPDVAELRVSGALSLDDIDASLRSLMRDFPVQVRQWHHFWIQVEARDVRPEST